MAHSSFLPQFAQDMEMNCILSTTNAPRNPQEVFRAESFPSFFRNRTSEMRIQLALMFMFLAENLTGTPAPSFRKPFQWVSSALLKDAEM